MPTLKKMTSSSQKRKRKIASPTVPKKVRKPLTREFLADTEKSQEFHMCHDVSRLTDMDIHLFREGNHYRLYEKLGSHVMTVDGVQGVYFAVWAPNATSVAVMGDFNGWKQGQYQLASRWDSSGIWEGFISGIKGGDLYKYFITSPQISDGIEKRDPFAVCCELPPRTASMVWDLTSSWGDQMWMDKRSQRNNLHQPMSIYEMHFGSWRRVVEENNRCLTYREMAQPLIEYVKHMGFTHVEFMPLLGHPFYGSWGYQTDGYFAPASLYGSPQDLMYLVSQLHENDIGVILDWVPSHFPTDAHSLDCFDGTKLFEHEDPRKGFHPDWKSNIFNYGRTEVRNFLISSALFWLDKYHMDGLRVDGVASMLYLDYSRDEGEWISNEHGGRENIEAISFLKRLNEVAYENYPDIQMIAEESTSWPQVSRPTDGGGLGFGMKWNMGWMHDTLEYFQKDPIYRQYHHNELTFSLYYAFTENFLLALSHDEVVHGKGSLIGKMPGDDWQKFANLRLLYGFMFGHPGKKLIFMGGEFAQWQEWNHETSLEWQLCQHAPHAGMQQWVKDLNQCYRTYPALYQNDFTPNGFEWIDFADYKKSILAFRRKAWEAGHEVLVICNFTPETQFHYRLGVPQGGYWREVLNSDAQIYDGSGQGNNGGLQADIIASHGHACSLDLTLPPLGVLFLVHECAYN